MLFLRFLRKFRKIYLLSFLLRLLPFKQFQKSFAAFQNILPGFLEISGIPRIRNLTGPVCIVHQQVDLPFRISAADAVHVPEIHTVHADQQIILIIIILRQTASRLSCAADSVLRQFAAGRRIDRIAQFLAAGIPS